MRQQTFQTDSEPTLKRDIWRITALMTLIEDRDEFNLCDPRAGWGTLAAMTYIAECYGFRCKGFRRVGKAQAHIDMVRDPNPAARRRAAATAAAFPQAGWGGPLPGMARPDSLAPSPEARAEVELIKAHLVHDALVTALSRREKLALTWGLPACLTLVGMLAGGFSILLPVSLLWITFWASLIRFNEVKRAKLAQRLIAAGCTPVRDDAGRERYVRPMPYDV